MNILLVDDDYVDRRLVRHALNKTGFDAKIIEATSIDLALQNLDDVSFSVIVADYNLPGKNGTDLLLAMKEQSGSIEVPVIFVSHDTDEDIMVNCIDLGAHDFILKSEINEFSLRRAILQANKKLELEAKLKSSYKNFQNLAERDPLTQLFNRRSFETALQNNIHKQRAFTLLIIDIDEFKAINDNYGHTFGDKILLEAAYRIASIIDTDSNLFRLGGDEFSVVTQNIHTEDTLIEADKIQNALEKPFLVEGTEMYVSASIGSCASNQLSPGFSKIDIIRFADIAMYRAKKEGRGKVCRFSDDMQYDFLRRHTIEGEIRKSIKAESNRIYLQPIYDVSLKKVYGFEALLRCPKVTSSHNIQEIVTIAEDSGLIYSLGRWILLESILIAQKLEQNQHININLSPIQLQDEMLHNDIQMYCETTGVTPSRITLEITENVFLEQNPTTIKNLHLLKNLGFKLALDDFGTGFSSLSYLSTLPVDIVKFDRSFIVSAEKNYKSHTILKYVSEMLHNIGIATVAEGVETPAQADIINALNINFIQGYIVSKPKPFKDFSVDSDEGQRFNASLAIGF